MDYVACQLKEEDRRQAEMSGCAVDTRHRPLSPPLRTPERQAPEVHCLYWYFSFTVYHISNCLLFSASKLVVALLLRSCLGGAGWHSTVVRMLVYDWRTFSGLSYDEQLTGDLLGVNRPLYVSQYGQPAQPFILLGSVIE